MTEKFGITLEKRSFKELGDRAKNKSDAEAIQARKEWGDFPHQGLSERALNSAAKLYLAGPSECGAKLCLLPVLPVLPVLLKVALQPDMCWKIPFTLCMTRA